jgi:hypothetical protein
MTLEPVGAGAAGHYERGQHGQCGKNPTHLTLPSRGLFASSSGGLLGDLRAYRGPIPGRNGENRP